MTVPREGAIVAFVGDPDGMLAVGDEGKVLSNSAGASHVLWSSGLRKGAVTLTDHLDIVATRPQPRSAAGLVTCAVRDVMDREGPIGLLDALASEGHVASLFEHAEEALRLVASHVRADPSFKEVLASLEPDEGEEFVEFTATAVLRDAFGEGY